MSTSAGFLIGVDSDGCVFDTMEVKQKQHFHPLIVSHWHLEPVEREVRAIAEHVNLHSQWRGSNRFVALLHTFVLLTETGAALELNLEFPFLEPLREWVEAGGVLDHDTLRQAVKRAPALAAVLEWSEKVNHRIAHHMEPVPPFAGAKEALMAMRPEAEIVVVSLTPRSALEKEWTEHGLRGLVDDIAGPERGGKVEQLQQAMEKRNIPASRVLLIGDAPGDLQAARELGVSFFPTVPGKEAACWEALRREILPAFFASRYTGGLEKKWVGEFEAALTNTPPPDLNKNN